jgi:shikimate kinase
MADEKVSRRSAADSHIVLVGLMGTGKSTIGSRVAERLHRQFFDNDVVLERRTGHTAASLRRERGEEELHRLEADVLLECLSARPVGVIAAAASTILRAEVRDALRNSAYVVALRADLRVLTARLVDPGVRPLTGDIGETLARQEHEREALYTSIADFVVDTSTRSVDEAVDDVIAMATHDH